MQNPFTEARLKTRKPGTDEPLSPIQFSVALGVAFSTVYHAERGTIAAPKAMIEALERRGYDPDQLRRDYEMWRADSVKSLRECVRA